MRLVFDLETNGLLKQLTKIHCISIADLDAEDTKAKLTITPEGIEAAIKQLTVADEIIGHNIIGFDIPAIQKLHPGFKP